MSPLGFISRSARRIQHPAWTCLFALVLAGCVARLHWSIGSHYNRHSTIGGWIRREWYERPVIKSAHFSGWFLREPEGRWSLIGTPDTSADAVSRATVEHPDRVVGLVLIPARRAFGIFDPAMLVHRTYLTTERADGAPLSPDEQLRVLDAALRSEDFGPGEWLKAELGEVNWNFGKEHAVTTRTTILWPAVLNNTLAATAAVGFFVSLPWIPRFVTARRRSRRASRGLCPFCAYDRRSTHAESPCPECGRLPVIP